MVDQLKELAQKYNTIEVWVVCAFLGWLTWTVLKDDTQIQRNTDYLHNDTVNAVEYQRLIGDINISKERIDVLQARSLVSATDIKQTVDDLNKRIDNIDKKIDAVNEKIDGVLGVVRAYVHPQVPPQAP